MRSLFQDLIYSHYSLTSSSSLRGGYLVKMWAPCGGFNYIQGNMWKMTFQMWLGHSWIQHDTKFGKTPDIHWLITCPFSYFQFLFFLQCYSFKNFLSNHFLLNSLQSAFDPQHSIKIIPFKVTNELKMSDQKVNSVFILSKPAVACGTHHSLFCATWFETPNFPFPLPPPFLYFPSSLSHTPSLFSLFHPHPSLPSLLLSSLVFLPHKLLPPFGCIILFYLFLDIGVPYGSGCWPFFITHHSPADITQSHCFKYYLDTDIAHNCISSHKIVLNSRYTQMSTCYLHLVV